MKKIISLLSLAALVLTLTLASCEKEPDPVTPTSTIAKGTIMADRILFHDSINYQSGVQDVWTLQPATVDAATGSRTCEKGRIDFAGPNCRGLGFGDHYAVLVDEGSEIGPHSSGIWSAESHIDVQFHTLSDGDRFYVALRYCDPTHGLSYYGWAQGQFHANPGGNDQIEWLEVCYETRNGVPITAGARN